MKEKLKKYEQKITKMSKKYYNFALGITLFGGMQIIIAILITLFSLYLVTHKMVFLKVALTSVIVLLSNSILKLIFAKKRPVSEYAKRFKTYSFPSGHSSGSMIIYLNLAYLLTSLNFLNGLINFTLALIMILMIGWSRIYLKAHYLTDVLAGYTVGIIGFCLSLMLVY